MKVAIATVQVPFITGGAEIHASLLCQELRARGHEAEIVTIPFKWYPPETLINCMIMGRMMDLTEVNGEPIDLVIAMKFPAYYVKHPNKVLWLLHQHRQAYDLWGTPFGDIHGWEDGEFLRDTIVHNDNAFLSEAVRIFTNAGNTAKRLKNYNGIHATSLYHPPAGHARLRCDDYGDFVFYASRIDPMKGQRLLVEAARYLETDAKICVAGKGAQKEMAHLQGLIEQNGLHERVRLLGFISEEEKIDCYARCLGVYFGAYDEDYGYVTLEAFFSKKPVIIHEDAGGPLEFVVHGQNGYVLERNPEAIAARIDAWYRDRAMAKEMGERGWQGLQEKNIHWDHVIAALLGEG